MQRLSGIDAAFLYMETPAQHMHGVGVTIVDPSTIPGGYDFDAMAAEFVRRLMELPGFRRRLVEFPLGLDHPAWIDARVDIASHVVRTALPAPGTPAQFEAFVGDYAGRQLRRDRPLWEFCIVEGLEGGRLAVLAKIHHSIIDGVSGSQMMQEIYDAEPIAPPRDWHPEGFGEDEAAPSLFDLAAASLQARVTDPLRAVSTVATTLVSAAEAIVGSAGEGHVTLPMAAPLTPFTHSLTPRRSVSFARASLADVKLVKRAFDVTVNDVVLAACTMAMRRRLDEVGARPERPLVASVPVSARQSGKEAQSFNRVSAMFVGLPVHLDDPVEMLLEVSRESSAAKKMIARLGKDLLGDWVELLPPLLFAQAMQLYSALRLAERHAPVHNLVVSNVPGPPFPFYAGGAKVLAVYPLGPILEGAALNVTVFSYEDALDVGVVTCPELVRGVGRICEAVVDAIAELKTLAEAEQEPPRRRTRAKVSSGPRPR
jgi:diacylglycerol O-acyltransferase